MTHTVRLPEGWETARIGELAEVLRGVTYKKVQSLLEERSGFVPLLRATNIDRELGLSDFVYVPRDLVKDKQMLQPGDSVIAASSGSLSVVGKSAPLRHEWEGTFGVFCFALRPNPSAVVPLYLAHYLQTTEYRTTVSKLAAGVNINNLKRQHLEDMPVPYAPSSEQHRIVEAIESYLTRLDDAVALLERVQRNLKRYRASVLKAAVEGHLVPTEAEFAKKEGRSYEPANDLLKRVLDERRKKWIENAAEKARVKAEARAGKAGRPWTPKDNTKALAKARATAETKYKEPEAPDTTDLAELPEGWCWATATQVGEAVTGTTPSTKTPEYYGGDLPFFRPTDLGAGVDVRHARQYLTDEGISVSRVIPEGSILVTCIGATIGKTGLARVDCATNQQINALVSPPLIRETRYLFWFFVSPQGQQSVIGNASSTTLPILNKSRFERLPIPVPPLQEQTRIATELERTLSICGTTQQQFLKLRARCERLRQSILKWAFEGKLVPQDPSDEPASVLLERIKAKREFTQPRKRRRTGKRKNVNTVKHDEQLDLLGGSNK